MHEPLVSVIVPVYNTEKYLGEALESIMNQTYRNIEIIVVDDGSTDSSADVAASFEGVRVVRQENRGQGAARNVGIGIAEAELLSFLDADDMFRPDKTRRQVAVLEADPAIDAVFGTVVEFFSPELAISERPAVRLSLEPIQADTPTSGIVRRRAFEAVGLFVTGRSSETVDWILRMRDGGCRSERISDIAYDRRIHLTNVGVTGRNDPSDRLRSLKASLDRRRSAADANRHDEDAQS